jgi:peroxiredoxin family protein
MSSEFRVPRSESPARAEHETRTAKRKVAAIVTMSSADRIAEMAAQCAAAARSGAEVRVFFRDESIPSICLPGVAQRLHAGVDGARIERELASLAESGSVQLYACSSSLYVWGVTSADLLPVMTGARGLVAFLADDLAGADEVLSY